MSNLLIFDPADNLLAVLSNEAEEACAFWNAPFKEAINQGSTFEFTADGIHEDSKYIIAENQVAFMDKDGAFRLFVIKEPERIDGEYGPEIHAICEPAMLELNDEIITDVRPYNTTLRAALTSALNGVRWQVGQTSDNFGLNSTNFYYISVTEAIENIVNNWGGEIRDRVEIQGNRIVGRYIDILTLRGTNTGKRWEMDKDILSIRHQVQSYPKTALYGRGASLELEDGDGNATGGYSRKISFADVEWKKAKGDPVDKPKGQEWVGDPEALNIYGRPNKDGTLRHRFGIFESSEQEDPAQLLLETWNALQEQKHPLDNYEMDVFLMEELTGYEHEKVRLGDITVAIDRSFAKPIEAEERVISFEYDVADPEHSGKVELGQFINLYDAEIDNRVDQLERKINDRAGIWDNATKVIDAANSKNKNYSGPIEPVGEFLEGDQWFKVIDGEYTQTYIWNGEGWQLKVDLDVNIAKEEAAEASQRADDAFDKANEATDNARQAIENAQASFDKAQDALDTADAVNSIAIDAVNVANTAKQNAQAAVNKASLLESEVESISDDLIAAGGKITTIEQNVDTINNSLSLTIRTLSDLDGVVSEQQTAITALDDKIELRATKTSVDTLTGRVSDTESNIMSMAGQISLMAKSDDVYTKTQMDDALDDKLAISTYTSKLAQIDLSISGITNRVSSTESNINSINSNIASLDLKADGIISTVSQVQTDIDNLEIGGRNYALSTADSKTFLGKGGTNETGTLYYVDFSKLAGKTITISFDFIATSSGGNARFRLQQATSPYTSITELNIYTKTELTHYSHTMNLSSGAGVPKYLNIRMDDFVGDITILNLKLEIGSKATDWTPAPEDMATVIQFSTLEQTLNGFTTRVGTAEGNISTLQQTSSSYATRISNAEGSISSISQTLSGVQTTVLNKADKSTVTQLAGVVDTKISTTDANNKFATQSQLTQTSSSLTSTISSVQTNLDNLEIGGRNLVKNTSNEWKTATFGGWDYYFPDQVQHWSKGMTLTGRIYLKPASQEASIMLHVRYINGTYTQYRGSIIKAGEEGYSVLTATIQNRDDISHIQYSIRHSSGSTPSNTVQYKEAKVEKGSKATDWSPAPEDMATASQFSQLSDAINLRVTKDDLISQINIDTSGILIQGKKLVLDGNVTVNGDFRVASGNITSLDAGKVTAGTLDAAKVSVVNLNASNIKTGTLSGVTIRSTAGGDTTEITGGNISSTGTITRTFGASSTATYVSTFDSYNGVVRVGITSKKSGGVERVDSSGGRATMLTDKGITTQRAIHSGTSDKNGARFIDFFADETINSGVQGLGMHIFSGQSLRIEATQGITLTRASSSDNVLFVDGDMRARQAFVNTIQYNNDFSGTNIYVKPSAGGELRLTAANTTESYVDLRARQVFANTMQRNSGASGLNIYIKPGSGGEVRATLENTTDSYVPMRASSFPTGSMAAYKQDIRPHTESALAVINSATIYDYRLRTEVADGKDRLRTGLVIGENYNTPSCVIDGDGVEQYMMNSLSWFAIQELDKKYKALEVENFALKQRVEELEKAVYAA